MKTFLRRLALFMRIVVLLNLLLIICGDESPIDAGSSSSKSDKSASDVALFLQRFMPDLEVLRPLAVSLGLSSECFTVLAVEWEVLDGACLQEAIATALSYAIIVFSSVLKVPLIRNILKNASVEGLSVVSIYLETTIYSGNFIYNLLIEAPLKTYAETATLTMQNAVIVLCIWRYTKASLVHRVLTLGAFAALMAGFFNLPKEHWRWIIVYTVGCTVLSRLPQIATNFKNKHTGVLSFASTLMAVVGGSVRILTVIREVSDVNAVIPIVTGVSLQAVILSQIVLYRKQTELVLKQNQKKKKE